MSSKVKDLLKVKTKEVFSISPKQTVYDALKLMGEREVGALMVMEEGGKVVGIITERDYARKVILKGKRSPDTPVEEIMTPVDSMYTVKLETSVEDCMVLMTGKHVRHLPVFEKGQYVGLVSIGDAVKSVISSQEMLIDQLSKYIAGRLD